MRFIQTPKRYPPHSDAEIVAERLEMEDVSNDDDDAMKTVDEPVYCPNKNELLKIVQNMKKISLFLKGSAIVQSYVNRVACIIDQHFPEKSR